jgi:hypothetical protein
MWKEYLMKFAEDSGLCFALTAGFSLIVIIITMWYHYRTPGNRSKLSACFFAEKSELVSQFKS